MTRVAFFSADPLSAPPHGDKPRLLLDEELREIRQKVRAADYRDGLRFDNRGAARTSDLLQTLRETHPQVVHFSGHGTAEGLILMGPGRRQHSVGPEALAQMLKHFSADVRLVVLNACYSRPQAEAVAEAVGCAIGTRNPISDRAAITFGAAFYAGLAFGESVQQAYERAVAQMAVDRIGDHECPDLVHREDVDPAEIFLAGPKGSIPEMRESESQSGPGGGALPFMPQPPARPERAPNPWRRIRWMAVGVILAGTAATLYATKIDSPVAGCGWNVSGSVQPLLSRPGSAPTDQPPLGSAVTLAEGRAAEREGNDTAAFRLYTSAARAGNVEAMGLVGLRI